MHLCKILGDAVIKQLPIHYVSLDKPFLLIGNSLQMKQFCEDPTVKRRFLAICKPPVIDKIKVESGNDLPSILIGILNWLFLIFEKD